MINGISGLAFVLLAAVFWVQRDYTSQNGGTFPDPVIILVAVTGLALTGLGLFRRPPVDPGERVPVSGLVRAVVLLVAWIATLPILGYVVGGIVFFTLTALLMRDRRPDLKGIALDVGVAVGVVAVFYLLFTEVLVVRLPELAF